MSGIKVLLILFTVRLVVGYAVLRMIYGFILRIRRPFIEDKMKRVEATRIKYNPKFSSLDDKEPSTAVYEYYVDGKRYTSTLTSFSAYPDIDLKDKKTLYYRNNAKNVIGGKGITTENQEKILMFVIAVVYAFFMTILMQMIKILVGIR